MPKYGSYKGIDLAMRGRIALEGSFSNGPIHTGFHKKYSKICILFELAKCCNRILSKLDRVGPKDNRPSTNKLHNLLQQQQK